jgi:hypothetical protein
VKLSQALARQGDVGVPSWYPAAPGFGRKRADVIERRSKPGEWLLDHEGAYTYLYVPNRIEGDRQGREQYAGIRKDAVHVAGRICLVDALGPFGNPTSDSARTMVTTAAMLVVFAPHDRVHRLSGGIEMVNALLTSAQLTTFHHALM